MTWVRKLKKNEEKKKIQISKRENKHNEKTTVF